jgi:RNA polymerase sigma-70 factor (ECF subfamily)
MSPPDAALIARVLADDDRHAFAELVRRHQLAVRALLRRLARGDAALADDLAQETFLKAYRSLGAYRGRGAFPGWLYRIAYNLYLSEARRRRPEMPGVEEPKMKFVGPGGAGGDGALRHDLEQAMAGLRLEERAALALTYGQDLSHEEAAKLMDCPLGTLKSHVARAKEKLRIWLAPWQTGGAP